MIGQTNAQGGFVTLTTEQTISAQKVHSALTKSSSITQAQGTGQFRNVYTSQGPPSDSIGADGEIWVQTDPDLGTSSGGSNIVTVSTPSIYRGTYTLAGLGLTSSATVAEKCTALATKLPSNNDGDCAYVYTGSVYEKYVWHSAWAYDSTGELPPTYTFISSPTASVGSDLKPVKIVDGVPTAVAYDLVDTHSNQTAIAGNKTFTGSVAVTAPAPTSALVRNITISSSDPSGGSNGDVWIKY